MFFSTNNQNSNKHESLHVYNYTYFFWHVYCLVIFLLYNPFASCVTDCYQPQQYIMMETGTETNMKICMYIIIGEERKKAKYQHWDPSHCFVPIAVETAGAFGPQTWGFLKDLGRRITRRCAITLLPHTECQWQSKGGMQLQWLVHLVSQLLWIVSFFRVFKFYCCFFFVLFSFPVCYIVLFCFFVFIIIKV